MKFKKTIFQLGSNTGIVVPENALGEPGAGKRPSIVTDLAGGKKI